MKLRIVFPSLAFEPNKIDPEYAEEHAAVRLLGGTGVLFDFDLFRAGDMDGAFGNVPILPEAQEWTYRGWMMSPEEYQIFYNEMKRRGYVLTNNPNVYSICHVYPLIYPYIKQRAVKTFVVEEEDGINHDALIEFFGKKKKNRKLFVKDWIKSTKGTPGSTIIEDYKDLDEVLAVTEKLKEHRGNLFYGGFVFKEFVDIIKRNDGKDEEYRAFFIKDKLVTWSPAHGPGGAGFRPPLWADDLASNIPGDFYTLDFVFVEGKDGPEAVILEAGDGGVSGLSVDEMPIILYSAIDQHELIKA